MAKSKFTDEQIDALENLRDVVMMYKVGLTNSVSGVSQDEKAPLVLRPAIDAILAALAECEDDVD